MPWSGSTFVRDMGPYDGATCWQETDAAHFGIQADHHDVHDQDMADGINACINRSGANVVQANIPMGGFKLTGLAAGTAAGDSVRFEQLESGVMTTRGDMLYRADAGNARLPKGPNGQFLMAGVNDPQWMTVGSAIYVDTGIIGHTVPFLDGNNTWTAGQRINTTGPGHTNVLAEVSTSASVPIITRHFALTAVEPGQTMWHTQHYQRQALSDAVTLSGGVRGMVGTTATDYYAGSDRRMKENISDLDDAGAIIDALKPRRFKWKGTKIYDAGFVADELQDVLPNAVDGEKTAARMQMVAPAKLIPFLVAEVKALRVRVAELEAHAAA